MAVPSASQHYLFNSTYVQHATNCILAKSVYPNTVVEVKQKLYSGSWCLHRQNSTKRCTTLNSISVQSIKYINQMRSFATLSSESISHQLSQPETQFLETGFRFYIPGVAKLRLFKHLHASL